MTGPPFPPRTGFERRRRFTLLAFILLSALNTVSLIGLRARDGNWLGVFLTGGGTLVLTTLVIMDYFLVGDRRGR
jgi:hypothetical protein